VDGDAFFTVILSFSGTIVALAITKTVELLVVRALDRGGTRRDLVQQLASGLTAIEGFVPPLAAEITLKNREQLAAIPSGYESANLTVMSVDRALTVDSSAPLQRMLNLFFNRYQLFLKGSDEHRKAYYWLLDKAPGDDWSGLDAQDRVVAIAERRASMRRQSFEMLGLGYSIIEAVLPLCEHATSWLMRGNPRVFFSHLDLDYGLNRESAGLRAAYYRPEFFEGFEVFDPRADYVRVIADDDIVRALGHRTRICIALEFAGKRQRRAMRVGETVLLHAGARIVSGQLDWSGRGAWVDIPMPMLILEREKEHVLRLSNDVLRQLRSSRETSS